jgi:hypothetical protein
MGVAHRLEDGTRLLDVPVDRFQVKPKPLICGIFGVHGLRTAALDLKKTPDDFSFPGYFENP